MVINYSKYSWRHSVRNCPPKGASLWRRCLLLPILYRKCSTQFIFSSIGLRTVTPPSISLRTVTHRHALPHACVLSLNCSIDLLDVGAARAAARGCARHATRHPPRHAAHAAAAALRVHGLHDGRADALNLFLLVLKLLLLGELVRLEPREGVVDGLGGLLLVVVRDLILELVVAQRVLHRVAVVLKAVLGLDLLLEHLVLLGVLFRVSRHLLDVLLGKARLVVGDRDLVLLARRLLERRHVQHAVGVNVERDVNLRHAARHRRDA
mmetsp:Transcript_12940/g.32851  ORF Transcript_12940/g.32851 Transcript_12940/m.32851 type:complete len:266 (+) Transcript_12940:64-861(+)